jgi:hypothetical protein
MVISQFRMDIKKDLSRLDSMISEWMGDYCSNLNLWKLCATKGENEEGKLLFFDLDLLS